MTRSRSPLHRLVGVLLALWLVVFTTAPAAVHACPVHDGAGAQAHGTSHGGHNGHAAMTAMGHDEAPAPADHASKAVCQCPGSCSTVTPVQLAAIAPVDLATIVATTDPGLPEFAYVAISRALLLPYANGPPRA
jgi:hypothetical protein